MDAKTELELAAHLDEVRPFLELPAIQLKNEGELTATTLVAFNIAARAGVYGKGHKVEATQEFVDALASMETVFRDESGVVLQAAPGSNLLGNPLRVVLWLIQGLKSCGESLAGEHLLGLGAFGQLVPLAGGGKTYTLIFKGLPGGELSTSSVR